MPRYTFKCPECDTKLEVVRRMADASKPWKCVCGAVMDRDFQSDLPMRTPSGKHYCRPIVSDSLAIMPNQIAEHRKEFPNIQVTPEGQPVFDNYSDHEKYLKRTGFRKARQKIRRKPKTSSGK